MAKATAHITCDECGKQFTREQTFGNRRDADNWTEYVERAGGLCTECYRKQQQARNADKASAYTLPEISGKSDKQIAYATDVRNRFIAHRADGISFKRAQNIIAHLNDEDSRKRMEEDAEKSGKSFDAWLRDYMSSCDYDALLAYYALTVTDARTIIDELKYL